MAWVSGERRGLGSFVLGHKDVGQCGATVIRWHRKIRTSEAEG